MKRNHPYRKTSPAPGRQQDPAHSPHAPRESSPYDPHTGRLMGRKPVLERLESHPASVETLSLQRGVKGPAITRMLEICREHSIRFRVMDKRDVDRMVAGSAHQGVVAEVFAPGYVELDDLIHTVMDAPLPVIVILDQVQDPGNVGALARTSWALGAAGLVVVRHGAARLGDRAVKAAAGALDKIPVARVVNLARAVEACSKAGLTTYASGLGDDEHPAENAFAWQPRFPAALVLGNEEKGVRPAVRKACDQTVEIPFAREFDSLGVAQAGALLLGLMAKGKG